MMFGFSKDLVFGFQGRAIILGATRRTKEQSKQYRWVLRQTKTGGLWQGEQSSFNVPFSETAVFDMIVGETWGGDV